LNDDVLNEAGGEGVGGAGPAARLCHARVQPAGPVGSLSLPSVHPTERCGPTDPLLLLSLGVQDGHDEVADVLEVRVLGARLRRLRLPNQRFLRRTWRWPGVGFIHFSPAGSLDLLVFRFLDPGCVEVEGYDDVVDVVAVLAFPLHLLL